VYTVSTKTAGGGSSPRPALDRTRVVQAAIRLADEGGLAALSMRQLAARLGVVPMALYKHVADKEDLVAGMIDEVVASYPSPPAGLSWREAVRFRVLAARKALTRHPWMRPAIESATRRTPTVLAYLDATAGDFVGGGVSYDLAHYAMHALGHRIWGFSPEAFTAPTGSADAAPPPSPEEVAQMSAIYPHVVAIAMDTAARHPTSGCDEQHEFEFTLDLLLDAFERLHAAQWSSNA